MAMLQINISGVYLEWDAKVFEGPVERLDVKASATAQDKLWRCSFQSKEHAGVLPCPNRRS